MQNLRPILAALGVALCAAGPAAASDAVVEAREYKLMLNPSLFAGNAAAAVAAYWSELEYLIEQGTIQRPTTGNLGSAVKTRTVRFFDTPGSCVLKNDDYIFRERVENGAREVTLKYRSPDRFISARKDMHGSSASAQSKFEEDIAAPFVAKYSHSTTQPIGSGKVLNYMDDPVGLYPGLASENYNQSAPIVMVGGLNITEKAYDSAYVDLGEQEAEFTLSLWYASAGSTTPLLAEISFKYADAAEGYTNNVVNRAKVLFEAMQGMSYWVSTSSLTKTAFVYAYDPSFCQ